MVGQVPVGDGDVAEGRVKDVGVGRRVGRHGSEILSCLVSIITRIRKQDPFTIVSTLTSDSQDFEKSQLIHQVLYKLLLLYYSDKEINKFLPTALV